MFPSFFVACPAHSLRFPLHFFYDFFLSFSLSFSFFSFGAVAFPFFGTATALNVCFPGDHKRQTTLPLPNFLFSFLFLPAQKTEAKMRAATAPMKFQQFPFPAHVASKSENTDAHSLKQFSGMATLLPLYFLNDRRPEQK